MKGWDMMHRGVLLGMGSLTAIATYRSWCEYQKRIVINEQKEAARKKVRAAQRAAAQAAAEAQERVRSLRKKQIALKYPSGGGGIEGGGEVGSKEWREAVIFNE